MKRRTKIILIGIVLFIVALLAVGSYYADSIIERFVNRELVSLIEKNKDKFLIKVGNVKAGFFFKKITFSDVYIKSLTPGDTSLSTGPEFEFRLNELVIKLYDYHKALHDGELKIKELYIDEPNFKLTFSADTLKKREGKKKKFKSKLFNKLLIDNLIFNDGKLQLNKRKDGVELKLVTIGELDIDIQSTVIDLDSNAIDQKISYGDFKLNLSQLDFSNIPEHFLEIGDVSYNSKDEGFEINDITFENSKSVEEFKKTSKFNTPWIKFNIEDVNFKIPVAQVLDKKFHLDLLQIGPINLDFYKDNTMPAKDETKLSFNQVLSRIKIPVSIDTIQILPSEINIFVKDREIKQIEHFNLNDFKSGIYHLSSDTVYQKLHPELELALTTRLWDEVPVDIGLKMAIDSTNDELEGNVLIEDISYEKVKNMLEKRIEINLQSGYVDHFRFDFLLQNKNIEGNLDLAIRNIRVNTQKLILPEKIKDLRVSVNLFKLKAAFARKLGKKGKLIVDTFLIQSPDISWIDIDKKNNAKIEKVKVKSQEVLFKTYMIKHYGLENLSVSVYKNNRDKEPFVKIKDGFIRSKDIGVITRPDQTKQFKPGNLEIQLNHVSFNNITNHFFVINQLNLNKAKKKLVAQGIRYKSKGSKFEFLDRKTGDDYWIGLYIERGILDIDILQLIAGVYRIPKIKIQNPIITYLNDPESKHKQKEKSNKSNNTKIALPFIVDKIVLDRADFKYSIRTKKNKEHKVLLINKIDCHISNVTNDSLQLIRNPELKLDLIGKAYGHSRISISANLDQRPKKDKIKLSVDLSDVSLNEINSRFKPFFYKQFKKGKVEDINLVFSSTNKKIKGSILMSGLDIEEFKTNVEQETPDLLSVKIPNMKIDFSKSGLGKKTPWKITSYELNKPVIAFRQFSHKKDKKPLENKPVFAVPNGEPQLIIDDFNIKYASFLLYFDNDIKAHSAIRNGNIQISGAKFYKEKSNSILPFSVGNLVLNAKQISKVDNSELFMTVSSVKYNLKKEQLIVNNLKVKTSKTLSELYNNQVYRKPWFDIFIPRVKLNFKLDELVNTNPHIKKVDIKGIDFLYKFDYKLDINPKIKPLFVDMIKAPGIPYTIDTIGIENSLVRVYMQENSPARSGYLIFNDINGKIINVSADPEVIKNKPETWIDMETLLWGDGKSHIEGKISLNDPNKYFHLSGTVDTLDMTVADTLIKDVFNISIKSGILNRARFNMDFSEKSSAGSVWFDYEKLKVTIYKGQHGVQSNNRETNEEIVAKKDQLNSSFIMGIILKGFIREKNLPNKGNYVIGSTDFTREPDKPVFRYVWYSLSSGLLEVVESGMIKTIRNFGKGTGKENKK